MGAVVSSANRRAIANWLDSRRMALAVRISLRQAFRVLATLSKLAINRSAISLISVSEAKSASASAGVGAGMSSIMSRGRERFGDASTVFMDAALPFTLIPQNPSRLVGITYCIGFAGPRPSATGEMILPRAAAQSVVEEQHGKRDESVPHVPRFTLALTGADSETPPTCVETIISATNAVGESRALSIVTR